MTSSEKWVFFQTSGRFFRFSPYRRGKRKRVKWIARTQGARGHNKALILPSERGIGLGLALTQRAIARAREANYQLVLLDTLPTLRDAQRLYRRPGFKEIPPYSFNPIPDTVYMELDLRLGSQRRTVMQHILVYADSLSWGIIPTTRKRLEFHQRWPGAMEIGLNGAGKAVRVIEDCLNGRRTAWDDPFKPGRNGLQGLAQRIEIHSPLSLVVLMLGTNDLQSMHPTNASLSAQGIAALVTAIRQAPLEPGMPIPPILIVSPPPIDVPKGPLAAKFEGCEHKFAGLAAAYRETASALGCHFFDAGSVTPASRVDGIHLDADQHLLLGKAMVSVVAPLLAPSR